MSDNQITKNEWIYLGLSLFVMIILMVLINIPVIYDSVSTWNPIAQFLLLNILLYAVFFIVFRFIATSRKFVWEASLGSFLLYFATDLLLPEYHVNNTGLITGGIFGQSSSDYFLGYVYQTYFGVSGMLLPILVYPVSFTILFLLGAFMFKNFFNVTDGSAK